MPVDALTFDEFQKQLRIIANNTIEQGTKFESVMAALLPQLRDYQFEEAWRWRDWPDGESLTDNNTHSNTDHKTMHYHRDNASEPFKPITNKDM